MDLKTDLFNAVNAKAEQLREHRPLWMTFEELQFRVLCHALEVSAERTVGSALTLAGVYRALEK